MEIFVFKVQLWGYEKQLLLYIIPDLISIPYLQDILTVLDPNSNMENMFAQPLPQALHRGAMVNGYMVLLLVSTSSQRGFSPLSGHKAHIMQPQKGKNES
jgi:hypothetical protein